MQKLLLYILVLFAPIFAKAQGEWRPLADGLFPRIEAQSAVVNNKLYVFSGFYTGTFLATETNEMYDPITNQWTALQPIPLPGSHSGAAVVENTVWIVGGFLGDHPGKSTDQVQIYDVNTDSWHVGPALPEPRASGALVKHNNKLHYFGGLLPDRETDVADHYVLDLEDTASGWTTLAPLPEARNHLSGAAANGKIYALGGQYGHDKTREDLKLVHEYDPITDQWKKVADLPVARSHFEPGTIEHNNKIIIVGGRINNTPFTDAVTVYDPEADNWEELTNIPVAMLAPVAKIINNKLYVTHGRSTQGARDKAWEWSEPFVTSSFPKNRSAEFGLNVYPVPAKNLVNLEIRTLNTTKLSYEIMDLTGRIVRSQVVKTLYANTTKVESIKIEDLKPGLYLIRAYFDTKMITQKLMIE